MCFRHGASAHEKGTAAAWRRGHSCCPASAKHAEDTRAAWRLRFWMSGGSAPLRITIAKALRPSQELWLQLDVVQPVVQESPAL